MTILQWYFPRTRETNKEVQTARAISAEVTARLTSVNRLMDETLELLAQRDKAKEKRRDV